MFSANQKAFVICTRVTSLHSCYTFCTRVTEELHSLLSQSELSNFFVYIISYCNRIFISIPSIPLYTLVLWLYTLLFSKVQLVVYYECCRTLVIESQYLRLREWKVPRKAKRSHIKHWKKINETKGVHGDSWKPPQSPLEPFKPPKQLSSLEYHSFENT